MWSSQNNANYGGGGIPNEDTCTVTNCTIQNTYYDGGIYNYEMGVLVF